MTPAPLQPAGLTRRLAALFYDSLLILAIVWGVAASYLAVEIAVIGGTANAAQDGFVARPLLQVLLVVSIVAFYCYFWIRQGQTLGMQSWRLVIEDAHGAKPKLGRCLLRCLAACLSLACLGLGYWATLLDVDRKSWHDRLSGTRILVLPKPSSNSAGT